MLSVGNISALLGISSHVCDNIYISSAVEAPSDQIVHVFIVLQQSF